MVVYRFLLRNIYKSAYEITEEEKLQEVVDKLKDYLEEDLRTVEPSFDEDNPAIIYPTFQVEAQRKADEFVGENDYRRLCSVKSFMLGLVLLSLLRRHYTHASWF
jgi:hypothetical protein